MTTSTNLKQYGGGEVRDGRYTVAYTSLELVVDRGTVYLRGRTLSPQFIDFTIPLEHHVEMDPRDGPAKDKIQGYLRAAFPEAMYDTLNEWLAHVEEDAGSSAGASVWRLKYLSGEGDVDRQKVEEEVQAWLSQNS